MRKLFLIFCAASILNGCAIFKSSESKTTEVEPIIRLADTNIGKVAKANSQFVVVTFPFGGVPPAGQKLNVYRNGKKVAELKVTGPQRDLNTVADVVSGEAQVNDEVRTD